MDKKGATTVSGKRVVKPAAEKTAPRYKMIALDLDGTLLSSRKTITPKTVTAVRAAVKAGVKVVLATARPPRSVRGYYVGLKLDTLTVNYNGALIWDEHKKRVVEHSPLDPGIARKVIAWARKKYPEMLVSVEILDKWYTDHYSEMPEYFTETSKHFSPDFVGPIEAFLTVPITKLMLLGNPIWIEEVEKEIGGVFGKKIAHVRSDPHLLQIMNPSITKARALEKVATGLGIKAEEVMAMGDAPNDLEMLEWAGLAVVPDNGWKEAKGVADAVVASNDADGVAEAILKYVL